MLVTFYCDAYENITLFGDVAKRLLSFMQQSGTVPGAILAKDVPQALALLKHSVLKQKSLDDFDDSTDEDEPEISIDKRAIPIIALLEAAARANCDVMWRDY